jgi:hypothetical protein
MSEIRMIRKSETIWCPDCHCNVLGIRGDQDMLRQHQESRCKKMPYWGLVEVGGQFDCDEMEGKR